jgi:hypothetical protein
VELQASEKQIGKGLEIWAANLIKASKSAEGDDVPWRSTEEFYQTIDSIQAGSAPWTTHRLKYNGPRPANGPAPQWMDQDYDLNTRNILQVLELQLSNTDFDGHFDYTPYIEFNPEQQRVWSNMMSGDWAYEEAVGRLSR